MNENTPNFVGFWPRAIATVVDMTLQLFLLIAIYAAFFNVSFIDSMLIDAGLGQFAGTPSSTEEENSLVSFLIQKALPFAIIITFWIYKSATPGKMAYKMIIVDADGVSKPSPKQMIIRYFACFISLIPAGLGFLWVLWDEERRTFHDMLASTRVVYKR